MAMSSPVSNILTLLAFAGFLFWLNPLLAAVSLSIYPAAMLLIPFLQKRANIANKARVDQSRIFSGRIAEAISGIHEIHGNGTYRIEMRKFDKMVERLRKIRVTWGLYRFGVKSTNNLFTSLGPFLVFILGGYLTIKGQLELGSLVAFLSAQEKLYDPWKELIEFYQVYQDGVVSYTRTMEFFDAEPEHRLEPTGRKPLELEASLDIKNLSFVTESGIRLLDDVNLTLKPGEHLALVGFSGSGKSTLALCIGQLYNYSEGHIRLGNEEVAHLTRKDVVTNVGIVAQNPFIFEGSMAENLLYSCEAAAPGDRADPGRHHRGTAPDRPVHGCAALRLERVPESEKAPGGSQNHHSGPAEISGKIRRTARRLCRVFQREPIPVVFECCGEPDLRGRQPGGVRQCALIRQRLFPEIPGPGRPAAAAAQPRRPPGPADGGHPGQPAAGRRLF
jgi:hypothetical protein